MPKAAAFAAILPADRFCADRFLADRFFAAGYRLQATGFLPMNAALATANAALATTNAGTNTGKTPFANTNAALTITNDLPRIQSSSRSYTRMRHSTPRVRHSCSRRNCPGLNEVEQRPLLSSLLTVASSRESNGCKTVSPGDTPVQANRPRSHDPLREGCWPDPTSTETGF